MIADDVVALALAKLYNKDRADDVRSRVEPGVYEIDATIKLEGRLTVHKDHMAENHQRLNPLLLIAILLDGVPRQVRNARIREAVGRLAAGETPDISEIKAETEEAVRVLMEATSEPRKGKAIYTGDAELIAVPVAAAVR